MPDAGFDVILDEIIRREGGFVNDPADRGGATKYGITIGVLRKWRSTTVTVDDVRALTKPEAKEIYRARYILAPRFDRIKDADLRGQVVDYGVNSGPGTAARDLQRAPDGIIGPKSLNAVTARTPVRSAIAWLCCGHGGLAGSSPTIRRRPAS